MSKEEKHKVIHVDEADRGDKFVVTADLPGMEKDEVKINVTYNDIEISEINRLDKSRLL